MTDHRTGGGADASLDERLTRALAELDGDDVGVGAGHAPVDVRDPEVRPRRFGVRDERESALAHRLGQHELRLDALTTRVSGVALRTAALQAALDRLEPVAPPPSTEVTARLDAVVLDQMEGHAAHELTVKLLAEVVARLEAVEAARAEERDRIDELAATVDALAKKARGQAGQITRLRNQLKALPD